MKRSQGVCGFCVDSGSFVGSYRGASQIPGQQQVSTERVKEVHVVFKRGSKRLPFAKVLGNRGGAHANKRGSESTRLPGKLGRTLAHLPVREENVWQVNNTEKSICRRRAKLRTWYNSYDRRTCQKPQHRQQKLKHQ